MLSIGIVILEIGLDVWDLFLVNRVLCNGKAISHMRSVDAGESTLFVYLSAVTSQCIPCVCHDLSLTAWVHMPVYQYHMSGDHMNAA